MGRIIDELTLIYDEWDWRKKNKHNNTSIANSFVRSCVSVGKKTYGKLFVVTSNHKTRLNVGSYCSIGPNVVFVVSGSHPMDSISTFPFKVYSLNETTEDIEEKDMYIDDDVWIGANVTVLSGVHIGQGAVIGAGSVVTKDIPPYAVAMGVPAKVVKYRFDEDIIKQLLQVDFSKLTDDLIIKYKNELYEELTSLKQLDWLPKKNKCMQND